MFYTTKKEQLNDSILTCRMQQASEEYRKVYVLFTTGSCFWLIWPDVPLESAYWVISFISLHYASVPIIQQPWPFLTTVPPSCIYFFRGKVFYTFNYLQFIISFQTYHLLKIRLLLFVLIMWLQICKDLEWSVLTLSFSKYLWFYCIILPT